MRFMLLLLLFVGCVAADHAMSTDIPVIPVSIDTDVVLDDAGASPDDVGVVAAVAEPPKQLKNTIVQYTIKSCRWCDYDREKVLPNWVKRGWKFDPKVNVIDETANPKGAYPRYEIYDANGNIKTHTGSLISWKG